MATLLLWTIGIDSLKSSLLHDDPNIIISGEVLYVRVVLIMDSDDVP